MRGDGAEARRGGIGLALPALILIRGKRERGRSARDHAISFQREKEKGSSANRDAALWRFVSDEARS
jgi:hypothetical protein